MTLRRLTCKEIILNHLGEYLDGSLRPEIVEELERHLARCPACVAYLNTYRRTQQFTRRIGSVAMTKDMKARLCEFLLARLAIK
jgi:anti-sigma factor RsiW